MALAPGSKKSDAQGEGPSAHVLALVRERGGYIQSLRPERALAVDAELEALGFEVGPNGDVAPKKAEKQPRKERAVEKPAPERAVPKD